MFFNFFNRPCCDGADDCDCDRTDECKIGRAHV